MKEGRKTMMLDAASAEAVRIHNGSNHRLLKFALMCSLLATGSRRLVSIFSCALRSVLSCVERCFVLFEHGVRYFTPAVPLIQNDLPNTAHRALIESARATKMPKIVSRKTPKKPRSLSEVVRSGTVGSRHG